MRIIGDEKVKFRKTVIGIISSLLVLVAIGSLTDEKKIVSKESVELTGASMKQPEQTTPLERPDTTVSTESKEEQRPTIPHVPQPTEPEVLPSDSNFQIHFIDVGQADAALIECDGHYMLIDGGNKEDSNVIYSVLKKRNISKLDIVVGTHAHEDHIGGLPGAFNYATADKTLCPVTNYDSKAFSDFVKYAQQKGGGITVPKVGDRYALGSATIRILAVNSAADTNNTSIVLRIDYGQTSFIFTGDAERETEQALLNAGVDLKATVLKVGHHGSDTSTTYPFLREIMPEYAVISVGKGNRYGHPTENTLSRLRDADVKTFRTDMQGDICCISDGRNVVFQVTKNETADVFDGMGDNSSQKEETNQEPTIPPIINTPSTEETQTGDNEMVWIPKSGKKYHSHAGCSGMKNPEEVTKEEAENRGYTPCKKCW